MDESAGTFRERVSILVIDKLVLGAIIALALLFYDIYRTQDARNYQEQQAEIQLQYEQSRMLKEFLPVIQNSDEDLVTRAYVLRAAVLAKSVDSDVAFEIGRDFLRGGLSANHYRRVITATLPDGIASIAKRGVEIADEWRRSIGPFPNLDSIFNPLSGVEHLPFDEAPLIIEARLLRDVLHQNLRAFDTCACPELNLLESISGHLVGLFVLLQTSDREGARRLSLRREKALKLIGMILRTWHGGHRDADAMEYLEAELSRETPSKIQLASMKELLSILRWITVSTQGSHSDSFVNILAEVAVGEMIQEGSHSGSRSDIYWMRWNAAEALLMADQRAVGALPTINEFLNGFLTELATASDEDEVADISERYHHGKIIRILVTVLGNLSSEVTEPTLAAMWDIGEERLRYFPFLEDDLAHALGIQEN